MAGQLSEQDHLALAFYGFVPNEQTLGKFYFRALEWFERFGCPPQVMGKGSSKKLGDFARMSRNAKAEGFSLQKTQSLEIYSEPYDAADPAKGADFEVAISGRVGREYCYCILAPSIMNFECQSPAGLASEIIELINPSYGIGYKGRSSLKLAYFAMGIGYGKREPTEESKRIISWREAIWARLYLDGILGGVFPYNFLTAPQLNAKIGDISLKTWIQSNSAHGILSPLTGIFTLWSVADQSIPSVYKALWDAEIVFDYQRHIDRGGPGIIRNSKDVAREVVHRNFDARMFSDFRWFSP